jgi:hypothetical protein
MQAGVKDKARQRRMDRRARRQRDAQSARDRDDAHQRLRRQIERARAHQPQTQQHIAARFRDPSQNRRIGHHHDPGLN